MRYGVTVVVVAGPPVLPTSTQWLPDEGWQFGRVCHSRRKPTSRPPLHRCPAAAALSRRDLDLSRTALLILVGSRSCHSEVWALSDPHYRQSLGSTVDRAGDHPGAGPLVRVRIAGKLPVPTVLNDLFC